MQDVLMKMKDGLMYGVGVAVAFRVVDVVLGLLKI